VHHSPIRSDGFVAALDDLRLVLPDVNSWTGASAYGIVVHSSSMWSDEGAWISAQAHLGAILSCIGTVLGPSWVHIRVILGSYWGHLGHLGPSSGHLGAISG
jgi:hypothetical protein